MKSQGGAGRALGLLRMARRPSPRTLDAVIEADESAEHGAQASSSRHGLKTKAAGASLPGTEERAPMTRAAPLASFASANADADHGACVENAHVDEERLRSLGLVDAERLLDEIHLWECLSARDAEGYDDVHLFVDKSGVRLASFMTSENGGGGGCVLLL